MGAWPSDRPPLTHITLIWDERERPTRAEREGEGERGERETQAAGEGTTENGG